MFTTPHTLVSVAVASKVPQFWPAALVALVLHFVLDAIPHRDKIGAGHLNRSNILLSLVDIAIAVAVFFWVVKPDLLYFSMGVLIFGMLPDIISVPAILWPQIKKWPIYGQLFRWHTDVLQYSWPKTSWFWGVLPQAIVMIAAFYFLI